MPIASPLLCIRSLLKHYWHNDERYITDCVNDYETCDDGEDTSSERQLSRELP